MLYVAFMRFYSSEDQKHFTVSSFAQVQEEKKQICRWQDRFVDGRIPSPGVKAFVGSWGFHLATTFD
jgi:hypothetical protein